jgi:hypothetical protein
MKKISKIKLMDSSLTQLTLLNICSLRVYAYTDKSHGCFSAAKASATLSKPDKSVFDFPAAHRNIAFGGQV